jgi:pimeloyl-ACP methyl ester carboxylesterase
MMLRIFAFVPGARLFLLEYDTVKTIYLHGAKLPELISPDNWSSDYYTTLQKPNGRQIQLDLFYDYRNNVMLYPKWQKLLRKHQPPTVIFWGQDDIFFTREGGEAYLADLPKAEMHRLEAGHFAVEDCLAYISDHIHRFYDDVVAQQG